MLEIFWIDEARATMKRAWDFTAEGMPEGARPRSVEQAERPTALARLASRVGALVPLVRRPAAGGQAVSGRTARSTG